MRATALDAGLNVDHDCPVDLEELLHIIQDAPLASVPRPSKTRKFFAMRACRTSVMIGKALDTKSMRGILDHMGTMNQPWVGLARFVDRT